MIESPALMTRFLPTVSLSSLPTLVVRAFATLIVCALADGQLAIGADRVVLRWHPPWSVCFAPIVFV